MKYILLLCMPLILLLSACEINPHTIYVNEKISPDIKTKINDLDLKTFSDFKDANYRSLYTYMTPTLKKLVKQDGAELNVIHNALLNKSFVLSDEYYINSMMPLCTISIDSGEGDYRHIFSFKTAARDFYVSCMYVDNDFSRMQFTLFYCNTNTEWLLNGARIDYYSILGKLAPDYYYVAKELYENGNLIDAADNMGFCLRCLNPAGEYYHYLNEKQMQHFADKIKKEANAKYPMPRIFTTISSEPQVISITPRCYKNKLCPEVSYITKFSVDSRDTIALKKENQEMQQQTLQLFGINKDNAYIIYRAYNQIPDADKDTPCYVFIQNVSE